jgi:hypothetical protein
MRVYLLSQGSQVFNEVQPVEIAKNSKVIDASCHGGGLKQENSTFKKYMLQAQWGLFP